MFQFDTIYELFEVILCKVPEKHVLKLIVLFIQHILTRLFHVMCHILSFTCDMSPIYYFSSSFTKLRTNLRDEKERKNRQFGRGSIINGVTPSIIILVFVQWLY